MTLDEQSWTWTKECVFPSDMDTAHRLIREVMIEIQAEQWNDKDCFALELVLEEILNNAVKHGNHSDPAKNVCFVCKLNRNKVYVRAEDEGTGFNPHAVADPRMPENQMSVTGRGILLITHFATRVEWNERGNVIEIEKERANDE